MLELKLNTLLVYILCGILLGALGVQIVLNEQPCPLCLIQRMGMFGVATGALLNVQFGIKISHYALILLSCLMGGFVALRQIALHVCPNFPAFGIPVFGLSLYTWSFLIFVSTAILVTLLLFMYDPFKDNKPEPFNKWSYFAFALVLFVAMANIVSTFYSCGFGPCND